jgi:hypothetical protein
LDRCLDDQVCTELCIICDNIFSEIPLPTTPRSNEITTEDKMSPNNEKYKLKFFVYFVQLFGYMCNKLTCSDISAGMETCIWVTPNPNILTLYVLVFQ